MPRLLLAIAASLLATSAFAADLAPAPVEPAAPLAAPFSWTGFYAGVNAGYHWGNGKYDFSGQDTRGIGDFGAAIARGFIPSSGANGANGAALGGQVGYNYQFGQFVGGVEADISWFSGNKSTHYAATVFPGAVITTSSKRSTDYFGTVRARLGYTPIDRFLVYATGGLAYGEAKSSFTVVVPYAFPPLNATSSGKSNVGWTVGAGLEYAFTDHWTAKVEYLYYDLGSKSSTMSYAGISTMTGKAKNDGSLARVGVNYKF
ncbi:outer membrane protein [Labrys neptuniae]